MSSLAETDTLKECAICLDCSTELVHCCPCQSENDLVTCETCLTEYIHIRLAELVPFVCPQLPCPCHANTLLDFDLLEAAVSESLLHKYENTAGLALQFRCGSCHVSDSISVPFNPISCDDATGTTLDEWSNYLYADAFAKYKSGHMSIDAFYTRVKIWCKGLAYDDAWRDFSTILGSIRNPERRNALHLRYLRDHPIFETRCCSAPHCFQCKVYGAHSDRSCEEMAATFDPSTLSCIGCGITLVKGDGCDHVTCICGFDFGFSQELQHFLNADMFRKEYPLSTSLHCVSVLCAGDDRGRGDRGGGSGRGGRIRGRGRGGSRGSESSSLAAAMGWRHRHQFEVDAELETWWQLAHPLHTDQCCVIFARQGSVGKMAARDLWKNSHYASVERREEQRNIAIASLFESLYMECDRLKAATRLREFGDVDRMLVESAAMWLAATPSPQTQHCPTYTEY